MTILRAGLSVLAKFLINLLYLYVNVVSETELHLIWEWASETESNQCESPKKELNTIQFSHSCVKDNLQLSTDFKL